MLIQITAPQNKIKYGLPDPTYNNLLLISQE
jgi:hypothetical protein